MQDEMSHLPTKTLTEAVDWFARFDVSLTERFIREATDKGALRCQIVAGRRMYSTAVLYEWVVSLPSNTRRGKKKNHVPQR
ncbi:hypothetical protein MYFR107205_20230 [Mycolicibacterium frederiksbergense]